MKFKILVILFLNLNFISLYCQEVIKSDTIPKIYESERNYIGINLSPLFNYFVINNPIEKAKISFIYKKNFGNFNARFSFNYFRDPNNDVFDYFYPISSSDSTITYRYLFSDFNHFDFRFGFEKLRYLSSSRFHIGLDGILGLGSQTSNYGHQFYMKDTTASYSQFPNNLLNNNSGNISYNYLIAGFDISFGMDLFLSESILLTFQFTPQFNYCIVNKNSVEIRDPIGEYKNHGRNYADFKIGYFDFLLNYKF
jgi:hypothetical protein